MDYLTLIEDALAAMEDDWPRDDDDHLIPCAACEHAPVERAICGEEPIHTWHRDAGAFDALLERDWVGAGEWYLLDGLGVGTARTIGPDRIQVSTISRPAEIVAHERDIVPTLMRMWGYPTTTLEV